MASNQPPDQVRQLVNISNSQPNQVVANANKTSSSSTNASSNGEKKASIDPLINTNSVSNNTNNTSNAVSAQITTVAIPHEFNLSNINSQTSNSASNSETTNKQVASNVIVLHGTKETNNKETTTERATTSNNGNMTGYLSKWTNYIKGYQKRWFSLNNGLLSYYRNPNEAEHTCRGTINLANANIQSEDACHFVVNNGGAQTFHLKAATEVEKQKWVSALELAKNKARQYNNNSSQWSTTVGGLIHPHAHGHQHHHHQHHQQPDSDDEESLEAEKTELENMLRALQHKLNELSLSHEFVLKQSTVLGKSLNELENVAAKPDETTIKKINERSTVYKIAMLGVVNHCQEFINLAQFQTRKMHKVLQSEREARCRLEEMVQEMAKQHLNIETQLSKRGKRPARGSNNLPVIGVIQKSLPKPSNANKNNSDQALSNASSSNSSNVKNELNAKRNNDEDSDENMLNDDEFHDAEEDFTQFSVTLPRQKVTLHHRNPSNISKLYLQESDISSDDDDQQTIQVTMHTNKETNGDQTTTTTATSNKSVKDLASSNKENNQVANIQASKKQSSADLISLKGVIIPARTRRKEIIPRPNYSLNLWSIMKNCIGKDLSKIPIPVNFSEPLSMLQRVTEELEYSNLLDLASESADQWEQLAYLAAFTVSSFSTTSNRTNKPFNPLLGETFECDRLDDFGWRCMSEQVSHHPPGFALHAESLKDWVYYQEFTMSSKFRGQYLQIIPLGTSHLEFKKTGHHYTWRKVATFVRNVIVGKLWIDHVGEMDIINHKTKDVCHLKFFPYSYFTKDPPRKVTGIITDSNNVARYVLNGTWSEQMEGAPVLNPQVVTQQTQLNTGTSKVLWRRRYPPPHLESMYNFTELAVQLNEPEAGVAPTDTRLRPDQRLMEDAKWDEANKEKLRLEEKQRNSRRQREMKSALANGTNLDGEPLNSPSSSLATNNNSEEISSNNDTTITTDSTKSLSSLSVGTAGLPANNANNGNTSLHEHEPVWFKKINDPYTNQPIHVFKNEYWDCKMRNDWSKCPDIY